MKRVVIKIFLFALVFVAVERMCHKVTQGFRLHKIASSSYDLPEAQVCDITEKEQILLKETFNKPFYLLGSGGQSYAFISQDRKIVLKFFKQHHMRKLEWLRQCSLPGFLEPWRNNLLKKRHYKTKEFVFNSCKIAYEKFDQRTGLLYLHLNTTDYLQKKVVLIDSLGIAHAVDLDTSQFALQTKAEKVHVKFKQLRKEGKLEEAKMCLDSLFALFLEQGMLGIHDRDPTVKTNFGFIGTQAIEIDLGSFSFDESLTHRSNYQAAALQKMKSLKKWIQKKYPELLPYYDSILKKGNYGTASEGKQF